MVRTHDGDGWTGIRHSLHSRWLGVTWKGHIGPTHVLVLDSMGSKVESLHNFHVVHRSSAFFTKLHYFSETVFPTSQSPLYTACLLKSSATLPGFCGQDLPSSDVQIAYTWVAMEWYSSWSCAAITYRAIGRWRRHSRSVQHDLLRRWCCWSWEQPLPEESRVAEKTFWVR